jgi:hypothetical protein
MVRESDLCGNTDNWLMRGRDGFVAVPRVKGLDLAARALRDTIARKRIESTFCGPYGWSSAGRFHHARWIPARSATVQAKRISTPLPSSARKASTGDR